MKPSALIFIHRYFFSLGSQNLLDQKIHHEHYYKISLQELHDGGNGSSLSL